MTKQYEFRPAKATQRRMILDACRRLTAFDALNAFQYVGFGGLEFVDFIEFHKGLGVSSMTSIERDTNSQRRFEFNKPYKSVRLLIGEARDMLPEVDWSKLSITWLDYTEVLSRDILRDVDYVVRKSIPGSIVIATVNGGAITPLKDRLKNLKARLGDLVSDGLDDSAMDGWGPAREQRRILQEQANSVARQSHSGEFLQLFNFEYSDDAKMLTWGGIVSTQSVSRTIESCRFDDLSFIQKGETPFEIRVPFLTEREIAYLEIEIGGAIDHLPKVDGIEARDIKDFAKLYRWRVGIR